MPIPNSAATLVLFLLAVLVGCSDPSRTVAPARAGADQGVAQPPHPPDEPECPEPEAPVFLQGAETLETRGTIADHAWSRDAAGNHHLYAQSWNPEARAVQPEFIRHFVVADDLGSMRPADHALQPSPGTWDEDGLWAPFILEHAGTYYMFYTGVDAGEPGTVRDDIQRIGLATSTDLNQWTKLPGGSGGCRDISGDGCVYEAKAPWTRWGIPYRQDDASSHYASACRDPFVVWDRGHGRWLLFVVVSLNPATVPGPASAGIAVAAAPDLRRGWTGLGYIAATKQLDARDGGVGAQQTGGIAENPFVAEHEGTFYLFFTDWRDPESNGPRVQSMLQYAASPALAVDAAGSAQWVYRGSIPDAGVNAAEIFRLGNTWIMSQSIANEQSGHGDRWGQVRLRRMLWNADHTFELVNYGPCR